MITANPIPELKGVNHIRIAPKRINKKPIVFKFNFQFLIFIILLYVYKFF